MTIARLPSTGILTYNTVNIIGPSVRTRIRAKPVLDEARRVIKYVEYHVETSGYVEPAGSSPTTDTALSSYRSLLLECGQALSIANKGFGPLRANDGTGPKDALWGPIPEILSWVPIGNDRTAFVEWACVVHLPCERSNQAVFEGFPMAVNYEMDTTIDEDGYTTQRVSGYLEIPMTRRPGTRVPPDSADRYYESIVPAIPFGFQRKRKHRHLSKNKNRLDFEFVDEEIPVPLPPGVTRADVRHLAENDIRHAFVTWNCLLSGSITLARGEPKARAWDRFQLILASRLARRFTPAANLGGGQGVGAGIVAGGGGLAAVGVTANLRGGVVIPARLVFDEEVFGRTSSFQFGYRIVGVPLQAIFAVSGLWSPVAGTDFTTWRTSLANSAHHPRGGAKLAHLPQDDVLVDICQRDPPRVNPRLQGGGNPPDAGSPTLRGGGEVPPGNSWLRFRLRLRLEERHRTVPHKPLRPAPRETPPDGPPDGFGFIGIDRAGDGGTSPSTVPAPPPDRSTIETPSADVIQEQAAPGYTIILEGSAVRAGHKITCPDIRKVGGQTPVLADRQFAQEQAGGVGDGIPVFTAAWRVVYYLPTAPAGDLPVPGNPALLLESQA